MKHLLTLFISIQFTIAQNLEGKWSLIISNETYSYPELTVIEITKKDIITYSFDTLLYRNKLKIDTINNYFKEGFSKSYHEYKYGLPNKNKLITYLPTVHNAEKAKFVYVRLLPTIINHPIDEILKKQYKHFYPVTFANKQPIIKLSGVMCSEQTMKFLGQENCNRYRLEIIDSTYFIVYYTNQKHKQWMVPIKEINHDHLIVYGVHGKEGFVKLNEIKEIVPTQKVFIKN
ncbi:hypothetical protein AWE51_22050 [Aquimarina aggregata]|uniref:DUF3108 domain-containing protein n=1 Tax=Aquimarina aggregata TaxID=1642818 RepID=A0A162CUU8_9FLAO|nr:hypothetical protein [Aquimarina aggregata]KZS41389.1 hypothetical protein AWE51_22050 [Aquimarina aggregata]